MWKHGVASIRILRRSNDSSSLLLKIHDKLLLFNGGENTTSSLHSVRHQLVNIFITRNEWKCLGGLVSLLSSWKNPKELKLIGPYGLTQFIATIRHFAHFDGKLNLKEICDSTVKGKIVFCSTLTIEYRLLDKVVSTSKPLLFPAWNNFSIFYGEREPMYCTQDSNQYSLMYDLIFSDKERVLILHLELGDNFPSLLHDSIKTIFHLGSFSTISSSPYQSWISSLNSKIQHVFVHDSKSYKNTVKDFETYLHSQHPLFFFTPCTLNSQLPFPRITFLGTSSRNSTVYRNTSSILIHLHSHSFILLDVGEGTMCRIIRIFGSKAANFILQHLKLIYISHRHNDHHLGLIALLKAREEYFNGNLSSPPKLYLVSPRLFEAFLKEYHTHFENIIHSVFHIRSDRLLVKGQKRLFPHLVKKLYEDVGLSHLGTFYARHIPNSFSLHLVSTSGFNLIYSGDTRPNSRITKKLNRQYTSNIDLIIHEATYGNNLQNIAIRTKHSTISEAISVGKSLRAKYIVLTHFSPIYSQLPQLNDIEETHHNVSVSFDHYTLHPNNLSLASGMTQELKKNSFRILQNVKILENELKNKSLELLS